MMKSSIVTFCLMTGIILIAVVVGRSGLLQNALAEADGYEVVVDHPQQVLEAQPDSEVPVDFDFKNISGESIQVVGLKTGCGCTVAENIPCTIAPHTTQTIRLLVSTRGDKSGETINLSPEYYLSRPSRRMGLSIHVNIQ